MDSPIEPKTITASHGAEDQLAAPSGALLSNDVAAQKESVAIAPEDGVSAADSPQREPETKSSSWETVPLLDGGWGWMVVLGSWLAHFLVVGLARSSGIIYMVLLEKFQGSDAATAWVQGLENTIMMTSGPVASILCSRFSCRPVVMAAGVLLCSAWLISAFSTSLFYLYFSYSILGGLGCGLVFTPMYIIVGEYFDKKKGQAMSLASSGSGFGALVLAPLTQYLLDTHLYTGTMIICSGLCLNLLVAGALFRSPPVTVHTRHIVVDEKIPLQTLSNTTQVVRSEKSSPSENAEGSEAEDEHDHSGSTHVETTDPLQVTVSSISVTNQAKRGSTPCPGAEWIWRYLEVFRNRSYVMYCVNMVTMPYAVIGALFFLPSLAREGGVRETLVPTFVAIAGIADIVGRFTWGYVFDLKVLRLRRRPLHSFSGIILGLLTVFIGTLTHFVPLAITTALWAFFQASYHGQRITVISEFVSKSQLSLATGYMVFFQGLGNFVALSSAGFLKDYTNTYSVCYYFGGSLFIVTCSFMLLDALCCKRRAKEARDIHV